MTVPSQGRNALRYSRPFASQGTPESLAAVEKQAHTQPKPTSGCPERPPPRRARRRRLDPQELDLFADMPPCDLMQSAPTVASPAAFDAASAWQTAEAAAAWSDGPQRRSIPLAQASPHFLEQGSPVHRELFASCKLSGSASGSKRLVAPCGTESLRFHRDEFERRQVLHSMGMEIDREGA